MTARGARALVTALVLSLGTIHPVEGAPGDTELISLQAATHEPAYSSTVEGNQTVSADGRFVAFRSAASTLVADDTNGTLDVFVRDRLLGVTERISVPYPGAPGDTFHCSSPAISADGRHVAFTSSNPNVVPGATVGDPDVYVRDRESGTTERISVSSAGAPGNYHSDSPSLSADGRYVAFRSDSSNLVTPDLNGYTGDVFVHDRQTGETRLVSVDSSEAQGNGASGTPTISADGRYVAFPSSATNLVPNDTNGHVDYFVHDMQTGITERVSVSSSGAQGDYEAGYLYVAPSISADGRLVAFASAATNLVAGDYNEAVDVFVRDRWLGTTQRVTGPFGGRFTNPSLSADGRYLALETYRNVYIQDRQTGVIEEVDHEARRPSLSADGHYVVFADSYDLLTQYANVYIHERIVAWGSSFSLLPTAFDFGKQTLNTSSDSVVFILMNTGTAPLPILGIKTLGGFKSQFPVANNNCGYKLAVGDACGIEIAFSPFWLGDMQARLQVIAGEVHATRTSTFTGTGVRSSMNVSPTSVDFGRVALKTTSVARTVTIASTGESLLTFASIRLGGTYPTQFAVNYNTCVGGVPAGASCTAKVIFKPTSTGAKTAFLIVQPYGGAKTKRVSLSGTGF